MGDGMGGGWNGRFWGAPFFGQSPGKRSIFPQKDAKSGRPKNGRSNHHPSHPPLDVLLLFALKVIVVSEVTLKTPPNALSNKHIDSLLRSFFQVTFLPREVIAKKQPQKMLRAQAAKAQEFRDCPPMPHKRTWQKVRVPLMGGQIRRG